MASLVAKPGGRWAVQFTLFAGDTRRKTVHLGAMSRPQAMAVQERIEALVQAIRSDSPPDRSTAQWAADLDNAMYAKLARAGLLVPRAGMAAEPSTPLLGPFLDSYVASRGADTKPSTRIVYGHTRRCLVEFFGATRPLDRIAPGEAEDFRRWLTADPNGEGGGQGLASNTARRRCGIAKQFFRKAVKLRLIVENPFADVGSCSIHENRERDYYVTREEAQKVLDACSDAQWRLLFALSRFGGLRCPSEHLSLRWNHVDWERGRLTVTSPKTEHHEGRGSRVVPLFPELRPYLDDVWDQAEKGGSPYVITRYRDTATNLRTQLTKIIRRAGLTPWPKLWQNLRATRATELVAAGWPEHKVCTWLGHTEAVARKHYWQTTDDDYARAAARWPGGPRRAAIGAAIRRCKDAQGRARRWHGSKRGQSPRKNDLCREFWSSLGRGQSPFLNHAKTFSALRPQPPTLHHLALTCTTLHQLGFLPQWAALDSNQRLPPCEDGALTN